VRHKHFIAGNGLQRQVSGVDQSVCKCSLAWDRGAALHAAVVKFPHLRSSIGTPWVGVVVVQVVFPTDTRSIVEI
jgi:hypothetical protein